MTIASLERLKSFGAALKRHNLSVYEYTTVGNYENRESQIIDLVDQLDRDGVLHFHAPQLLQVMDRNKLEAGVNKLLLEWKVAEELSFGQVSDVYSGQLEPVVVDGRVEWMFLDFALMREGKEVYRSLETGDHLKIIDFEEKVVFDSVILRDIDFDFLSYAVDPVIKENANWCQVGYTMRQWGKFFFMGYKAVVKKSVASQDMVEAHFLDSVGISDFSIATDVFFNSTIGIECATEEDVIDQKKRKVQQFNELTVSDAYRKINQLYQKENRATDFVWFVASKSFTRKDVPQLFHLPTQDEFHLLVSNVVFPNTLSPYDQQEVFKRARPKMRWFKFAFAGQSYYGCIAKLER